MDIWLTIYSPTLPTQARTDLQETFQLFSSPLDERTIGRLPIASLTFLFGGRPNAKRFVDCLSESYLILVRVL